MMEKAEEPFPVKMERERERERRKVEEVRHYGST